MLRAALPPRLWISAWALASALGAVALAQWEIARQRDFFETDARIIHRLLSQRAVQHDAVLATLALLQPPPDASLSGPPEQRLPAVYPQILAVLRRDVGTPWSDPVLEAAWAASRTARRAVLADQDFANGRYRLVLAAEPASYALLMNLRTMVPWREWPMAPDSSEVTVLLEHGGQQAVLQVGAPEASGGWRFDFRKALASDSQPFDVVATRRLGWEALPWARMAVWSAAVAAVLAALRALQRQRAERRRAEELLRLGQVARLNALGELAAGMAHELNQPLTAVLANTQAARRLLDDEPPDLDVARNAMAQAAEQARRASDVVGRLRRTIERPEAGGAALPVDLLQATRDALYLLEPEIRRRHITVTVDASGPAPRVQAEPVALEQIIHNLLMNALQALEQVGEDARRLELTVSASDAEGLLTVRDSGPGFAPGVLARIFEPFFSTREGGLGLGLSLCETLATGMGGTLAASAPAGGGAALRLALPRAAGTA